MTVERDFSPEEQAAFKTHTKKTARRLSRAVATAFPDAQGEVWITDELQPCEHLWQCSDAQLVNRHFRDIEECEEVQMAHCTVLQHQPELVSSTALRRPINKRCNGVLPTVHSY